MGSFRADLGVSIEWSPCGTLLCVATTAPRLQVSNKVRIYTPQGALLFEKAFKYLFQVTPPTLPPAQRPAPARV